MKDFLKAGCAKLGQRMVRQTFRSICHSQSQHEIIITPLSAGSTIRRSTKGLTCHSSPPPSRHPRAGPMRVRRRVVLELTKLSTRQNSESLRSARIGPHCLSLAVQITSDFRFKPLAILNRNDSNHCNFSCDFYPVFHRI